MSIEPLWFDVAPVFQAWLEEGDFHCPSSGRSSARRRMGVGFFSRINELHGIYYSNLLEERDVPVFFKGNMDRDYWKNWREEFPAASTLFH